MKLVVDRRQEAVERGLISKTTEVVFTIACQLMLTDEERGYIKKYNIHYGIMNAFDFSDDFRKDVTEPLSVSIADLARGVSYRVTNGPGKLQSIEEALLSGCQKLKRDVYGRASYGGRDEVEL